MKVAMVKRKAQSGNIRDQVMNDWKSGKLTSEQAEARMKEAGV